MVQATQIPGVIDWTVAQGDAWSTLITFTDENLTGNTYEAKVDEVDGTKTEMLVTNTNLSEGQLTLSLTKTQMIALALRIHKWYFAQTNEGSERRWLAGNFRAIEHNK